MTTIKIGSLEEALLFLTQAVRAGEGGDPRAWEWLALGLKIVADHVDAGDPKFGTAEALVPQMLVRIGGRLPRAGQYLNVDDVHTGWLHYEHKDGRQAICLDGQASFAAVAPSWYRTGPVEFSAT
ncbi:MAG: hypothetical protein ACOZE7_04440 [Pseudomonadota bacterium]